MPALPEVQTQGGTVLTEWRAAIMKRRQAWGVAVAVRTLPAMPAMGVPERLPAGVVAAAVRVSILPETVAPAVPAVVGLW